MQEHNTLVPENESQASYANMQPLSLTDILDGMFSVYRNNFQLFFKIALVYFVTELVVLGFLDFFS